MKSLPIKRVLSAAVVSIAIFSRGMSPAYAHHGWGGYDSTRLVTLTGTVQEFAYQNPHASARVDVDGNSWLIVLAPPFRMQSRGLRQDAIRPGDAVTLEGNVSRSDPQELRAERIHADGKVVELR
jgi:Family of unknown function (DUF6152)